MNKDLRNMLVWMVFASALVAMAFWQAQVTVAREAAARNKVLPPPAKTRHAIRPVPVVFTGDPVADYIARCEKGLTDQEIGWIIEDFHNAGLDLDIMGMSHSDDEYTRLRTAQHHWYHDALVDGLRLNSRQSDKIAANLSKLFVAAKSTFDKAVLEGPPSSEMRGVETYARLAEPRWYFDDLALMPWNLCPLTPAQEKLTWKQWFLSIENKNLEISNEEVAKLSGGPLFRSPNPISEGYPIDRLLLHQSNLPNLVFPLLAQQKLIAQDFPGDTFSEPPNPPALSALENVRLLHPSQFKALLLFNPYFSSMLQSQLTSRSK